MAAIERPRQICGYPLPHFRLQYVQMTKHGWVVSLMREYDGLHFVGQSNVGPLEAWDQAIERAGRAAGVIFTDELAAA